MKKSPNDFEFRLNCLTSVRCWIFIVFSLLAVPAHAAAESTHQEAEADYEKLCAVCHGNSGNGKGRAGASLTPSPTNFTVPGLSASLTEERSFSVIKNGISGTSMVGYARKLTDAQIKGVAAYIRYEFMRVKTLGSSSPFSPGKDLYIEHCSACHGDNGNTAVWAKNGLQPPPRNFTAPETLAKLTLDRMVLSVTHGRPGTAMMPFKGRLSDDEILQVVDYIRKAFMNISKSVNVIPSSSVVAAANIENGTYSFYYPGALRADKKRGEGFYLRNCFTCHGKTGKGDGPRAHFNRPRPRDFTSVETRQTFSREALFHAIKKGKVGTVMPAWQTVLSDQKIANVAEFVFTEFVNSQERTSKKKTLN